MPNRNYTFGRSGEYYTRDVLRNLGYIAERTAASHGPFDVAAFGPENTVLVQCKRGGKPSPCEYKSLVEMAVGAGVIKLVLWMPHGLQAARILYSNVDPLPAWCAQVRWLPGLPPKQTKMRL